MYGRAASHDSSVEIPPCIICSITENSWLHPRQGQCIYYHGVCSGYIIMSINSFCKSLFSYCSLCKLNSSLERELWHFNFQIKSCSWRVRSVILFLNPQVGPSISNLVVPCSFVLSVYTVMLVLAVYLCPSSVRAVATFSGIILFPLLYLCSCLYIYMCVCVLIFNLCFTIYQNLRIF